MEMTAFDVYETRSVRESGKRPKRTGGYMQS